MPRHHYLVCYDISDDATRTAVFKTLRDHGDHVQYSVFVCTLTATERAELTGRLDGMIDHATDQVLALDLGPDHHPVERGMICLGRPFSPAGTTFIV